MKIFDKPQIELPISDMDTECIDLCNLLNRIPNIETFESCCGHYKKRYSIWFFANDISVLSRLSRSVSRNYSDGNWEIIADTTDTHPYGVWWLRSTSVFKTKEELEESVYRLMTNILYWFKDQFDNHFLGNQEDDKLPSWVDIKNLPKYGIDVLVASRNKNKEDGIWLYDICYWSGVEFENRTHWETPIKWIPLYDLETILK